MAVRRCGGAARQCGASPVSVIPAPTRLAMRLAGPPRRTMRLTRPQPLAVHLTKPQPLAVRLTRCAVPRRAIGWDAARRVAAEAPEADCRVPMPTAPVQLAMPHGRALSA
ncbi:inositol monophosphatase [Actinomyces sp. oral taxon 178 str. F0338]|nr:inositol monophosphatase [Actinomyces sp. oral taxon 178 str. F0338]